MKLTIAIPTYNREQYLKQCLDYLLVQMNDQIEIIVSDNASTDGTKEMMETCYKDITYFRNDKNLGMDGNFLNCLKKAHGDYILILSDDDIVMPNAISKILECIVKEEPDFLHLNSCTFEGEFAISNCTQGRFLDDKNIITYDKGLFLSRVGIFITYLSSLVFKRELVDKVSNPEQYVGTYFLQSHIALETTQGEKKLAIIVYNCIAGRGGNTGGYNLYDIWVKSYYKLLFCTAKKVGYPMDIIKKVYVKSERTTVRGFILTFRINNTGFDLKNRKVLFKYTWNYPSLWLSLYLAAFLPVSVISALRRLYKKIRKD